MTDDLLTQLERYGNVIDEAAPIFDFEGIETGDMVVPGHLQPEPSIRVWQQRGWPVAAASFGIVLLVVGGIASIVAQQSDSPSASGGPAPATTLTMPSTTTAPVTTSIDTTTTTTIDTTTTVAETTPAVPIEGCTDEYAAFLRGRGRACDLVEGEEVTPIFGPLLDGGWFDLTELRGRPAVVLTWVASYGPGNREALAEFQVLYDKWSDQVGFISISEDLDTDARAAVDAGGYTVPVITCFTDLGPEPHAVGTHTFNDECGPFYEGSLWVWWGNQDLPSWIVLDSEGRFVDIRLGGDTTIEEIDSLLASLVASEPDDQG